MKFPRIPKFLNSAYSLKFFAEKFLFLTKLLTYYIHFFEYFTFTFECYVKNLKITSFNLQDVRLYHNRYLAALLLGTRKQNTLKKKDSDNNEDEIKK